MNKIPFQLIDWDAVPATEHKGETGMAYWRTLQLGNLRIRRVDYSANYMADHWCQKGHIVHCLSGSFVSEMESGKKKKKLDKASLKIIKTFNISAFKIIVLEIN